MAAEEQDMSLQLDKGEDPTYLTDRDVSDVGQAYAIRLLIVTTPFFVIAARMSALLIRN